MVGKRHVGYIRKSGMDTHSILADGLGTGGFER